MLRRQDEEAALARLGDECRGFAGATPEARARLAEAAARGKKERRRRGARSFADLARAAYGEAGGEGAKQGGPSLIQSTSRGGR